jgi:hypothetical protein
MSILRIKANNKSQGRKSQVNRPHLARHFSAIRTDNGVPFASANALFGLSKLSVWWLRLGKKSQDSHI